ncbi:hypothetical protein [Methanoculleus sp.]|uniref:hypothetical protein n=1 Tax=Methanoculleus sp. TaxID=90427 RepID=UPI0025F7420E|nr:hypothetical protein [Methanoculleus sp.]MCK9319853.1 hypothetical protein [Methanoculleus sp.]
MSIKENIEKLNDILKKTPDSKFIYIRRNGAQNDVIDVPITQVIPTIKRNPTWEITEAIEQMDEEMKNLFLEDDTKPESLIELKIKNKVEVPPVPAPISDKEFETIMKNGGTSFGCSMCEFVGKNEKSLRMHILKKHSNK